MYSLTTLAALPPQMFLLVLRLVQFSLPWRIWPPSSAYARGQVVDLWPSLPQAFFAVSGTLDKYLAGPSPVSCLAALFVNCSCFRRFLCYRCRRRLLALWSTG